MRLAFLPLVALAMTWGPIHNGYAPSTPKAEYALAIHGGAGVILREQMSADREKAYRNALDTALSIGEDILRANGSALDAVEATIRFLEDCPLFNAGRGAVLSYEGRCELDASIMDGATQKAGAVGGVTTVRNPITLARAVMERSPHVMLTGKGAEAFAIENGIDTVGADWFLTPERWESWQKAKARDGRSGSATGEEPGKFGTVGCVALDKQGNLAAGTSTGGMTNKRWNRIGDTPIIGAGTYADNAFCAVSCTGHGEFFIRYAVAHDVWALMAYKGWSLAKAADQVIRKKLVEKGGEGGLIAVDKNGDITMPFNTPGMYRGFARPGARAVAVFK
ncbi:MAG: isoaspartyl peptidase/L-asparaginase [Saprospiraceae bacterium]|nr:isoaspartyl peptidase/L-asparaginase [Saprospiraceae bacterium]